VFLKKLRFSLNFVFRASPFQFIEGQDLVSSLGYKSMSVQYVSYVGLLRRPNATIIICSSQRSLTLMNLFY